jgi:hypothetical protein
VSRGRVEAGLERDLIGRTHIGPAERSSLRAQARAVDVAEAMADPYAVSSASRVYLDLLTAAGLTAGSAPAADTFGELLAELGRPTAGVRDAEDT